MVYGGGIHAGAVQTCDRKQVFRYRSAAGIKSPAQEHEKPEKGEEHEDFAGYRSVR